jgi:vacuolar iron transporter family protein
VSLHRMIAAVLRGSSVSSQRAQMVQEKRELAANPEAELAELTALYEAKGLSAATARTVATELTSHGALAAHVDAELHIDPADIPSPARPPHRRYRSQSARCYR